MITPEMLQQMQDTARNLIECAFQEEDSFCDMFIKPYGYRHKDNYELERVHLSGHRVRITIKFHDYSEKDIYIDISDMYNWYCKEYEQLVK